MFVINVTPITYILALIFWIASLLLVKTLLSILSDMAKTVMDTKAERHLRITYLVGIIGLVTMFIAIQIEFILVLLSPFFANP